MARIIESIANLAWPLIVIVLVVKLGPSLRDVLRQREFRARGGPGGLELEVGGQPVSAQRAVDDQRKETEGLRAELSLLAARLDVLEPRSTETSEVSETAFPTAPTNRVAAYAAAPPLVGTERILWVDDNPASIAYEIAALKDRGVEVVQSRSTADALAKLRGEVEFDVVVSDMGRVDAGERRESAGLELIEAVKASNIPVPVVIYTTARQAELYATAVRDAGGLAITASSTELFELLGVNVGPLSGLRLEAEVLRTVREGGAEDVSQLAHRGPVDMVIRIGKRRIGLEIKAWLRAPNPRAVRDALRRLSNLVAKGEFDEVWLITTRPLDPELVGTELEGRAVRAYTLDELRVVMGSS
ncbi:MAG: hypothetical protein JWN10_2155 [Solirubrobacterales bacterium]|nr:hypothetical protein [Solirubrobacterales bacterium]